MNVATLQHPVALVRRLAVFGLASTGVVLLFAAAAHAAHTKPIAREHVDRVQRIEAGPLQLSVRVGNRLTPLFQTSSRMDRWYLEAKEGARYEIDVRNNSPERVAFVMSVDGLNVINGERTKLRSTDAMYVLEPWGRTTVKGWRRSLKTVNRFVFVDEEDSYAERMGRGNGDLGWIRVAAFREDRPVGIWRDEEGRVRRGGEAAPQASRDRSSVQGESDHPGTGWGQEERDRVRRVEFDPERFPVATAILRYEYRRALVELGILPWRGGDRDRLWERENGRYGFATPPPGAR